MGEFLDVVWYDLSLTKNIWGATYLDYHIYRHSGGANYCFHEYLDKLIKLKVSVL